jgi:hypothetical protein
MGGDEIGRMMPAEESQARSCMEGRQLSIQS